jgi:hypothetical protein
MINVTDEDIELPIRNRSQRRESSIQSYKFNRPTVSRSPVNNSSMNATVGPAPLNKRRYSVKEMMMKSLPQIMKDQSNQMNTSQTNMPF